MWITGGPHNGHCGCGVSFLGRNREQKSTYLTDRLGGKEAWRPIHLS